MIKQVVDNITVFKFPASSGGNVNYIIRICSDDDAGFGEFAVEASSDAFDKATEVITSFYGKSISTCLEILRQNHEKIDSGIAVGTELALLDLYGRISDKSIADILHFQCNRRVTQLHAINWDSRLKLESVLNVIGETNKIRGIKINLSGNIDEDTELVSFIRERYPSENGLLVASASKYCTNINYSLESMGVRLNKLHALGVDVIEDPAIIPFNDWRGLSAFVSPLALSIDAQVRDRNSLSEALEEKAATVYKITPGFTSSIFGTIESVQKVEEAGGGTAIADGGLFAVGVTQWQMIAAGLGCLWCECLQKYPDSKVYHDALKESGLESSGGYARMKNGISGFGIELDLSVLKSGAEDTILL